MSYDELIATGVLTIGVVVFMAWGILGCDVDPGEPIAPPLETCHAEPDPYTFKNGLKQFCFGHDDGRCCVYAHPPTPEGACTTMLCRGYCGGFSPEMWAPECPM